MFGKPVQRGSERFLMYLLKFSRGVFDTEHLHPISLFFAQCTLSRAQATTRAAATTSASTSLGVHVSPLLLPLFYISFPSCPSNTLLPFSSRLIFLFL